MTNQGFTISCQTLWNDT